jgi:hypothetical protein
MKRADENALFLLHACRRFGEEKIKIDPSALICF